MDDTTRIQVEFPIRDTDHTFTVSQPTDGQMLVLGMSRQPADGDTEAMARLTQRIFRVVEKVMGPEQWSTLEYRMIDGDYSVSQVLSFVQEVVSFDWSGAAAGEQLQETLDREWPSAKKPATEPVGHGAPRVIRRG